jgi:hypothetical protein
VLIFVTKYWIVGNINAKKYATRDLVNLAKRLLKESDFALVGEKK